ncbi:MAG: plasmid stabilization protein [Pseudomonadota bacterium]
MTGARSANASTSTSGKAARPRQGTKLAEKIAARTVNKERAQHGEAKAASASSINDMASSRRGGLRSHAGAAGRTLAQLRNEAREHGVEGRSTMNKAQLDATLAR